MPVQFSTQRPVFEGPLADLIAERLSQGVAHFEDLRFADELVGDADHWAPLGVLAPEVGR